MELVQICETQRQALTYLMDPRQSERVSVLRAPFGQRLFRRVALRQEEVAQFIRATKSEKYSALVPLLGLQPLETAAENLRRLARAFHGRFESEGIPGLAGL